MTRSTLSILALAGTMLAGAAQAQPRCDDLQFRVWRPSGNTYFDFGQPVQLEPGEEAHLYIHYRAQGTTPYGTSASMGHAADYGFRGGYDSRAIFTFDKQNEDAKNNGRLELHAKGPGRFPIGYQITGVKSSGAFDRLPANCRKGLVEVQVGKGGSGGGGKPSPNKPSGMSARRAAQELSRGIHLDLMPWQNKPFEPTEVDAVLRRGRAALVDITTAVLKSRAFQDGAYDHILDSRPELAREAGGTPRVGVIAQSLLADLQKRFFGDLRVTENEHRNQMQSLLSCLQNPEGSGCRSAADAMINHPNYAQHHREALDAIEAGS